MPFDLIQITSLLFGRLFSLGDESLEFRFGIVDIGLVRFPLLFATLILAHILLCIVLQHGIFAAGKLRYGVAEHIFFLLQHAIGHAVHHQLLAIHNAVGNGSFRFQPLISSHIKTVFHAETKNAHGYSHGLMPVPLPQDTTVSLRVVHRPVRSIEVNKSVQPLLDVHSCSEGKCRSEDYTYLTLVYLVEDFKFLLDGHA